MDFINFLARGLFQTEKVKIELDSEAQACYALAISPDNKLCFSCSADGKIIIWDLDSKKMVTGKELPLYNLITLAYFVVVVAVYFFFL